MKILIIGISKDNLEKLKYNGFDFVFSLDDRVTHEDITLWMGRNQENSNVFQKEEYFKELHTKSLDRAVEYYTDFVAEWPESYVDDSGKNFKEQFQWNRMSTWWISKIVEKNPPSVNQSYYLIAYLLFLKSIICKECDITVATDDKIFAKAIKKNWPGLKLFILYDLKNKITARISETIKQCLRVVGYYIQLEIFKWLIGNGDFECISKAKNNIFFVTLYPINWVWQGDYKVDRLYSDTPLLDEKFDFKSVYLVSFSYLPLKLLLNPKKLKANLDKLSSETQRPVVFLESFILRRDLFKIYFNFIEQFNSYAKMKTKNFKESFWFRDLNVEALFLPIIHNGVKEQQKFGIAFQRFAEQFLSPQMYITYADTRIQGRVMAHCIKMADKNNLLIGIQHTTYYKNKLYPYHRRREIEQQTHFDAIQRSPIIDGFFIQGMQYKKILKQFYPTKKIRIIGSLKYDSYYELLKIKASIKKEVVSALELKLDQKVICIAPSTNDISLLMLFLKKTIRVFDGTKLILKLHPTTDVEIFKSDIHFQELNTGIQIISNLSTPHLLLVSDLVICADSTVAIEALIFGSQSIRITKPKRLPPYDMEPEIPCFSDSKSFIEWYAKWETGSTIGKSDLAEKYLYKIDGQTKNRFWQALQEIKSI
ncbi:MAG: hypothetical protein KKC46_02440 [Proteobacteria bacterium]|nr:hypothetical protein [Pseudomonadota bacterium]